MGRKSDGQQIDHLRVSFFLSKSLSALKLSFIDGLVRTRVNEITISYLKYKTLGRTSLGSKYFNYMKWNKKNVSSKVLVLEVRYKVAGVTYIDSFFFQYAIRWLKILYFYQFHLALLSSFIILFIVYCSILYLFYWPCFVCTLLWLGTYSRELGNTK